MCSVCLLLIRRWVSFWYYSQSCIFFHANIPNKFIVEKHTTWVRISKNYAEIDYLINMSIKSHFDSMSPEGGRLINVNFDTKPVM